ncbi:hypothetical protein ACFTY7_45450, partial [Streptomyces sp. NPDC057062]
RGPARTPPHRPAEDSLVDDPHLRPHVVPSGPAADNPPPTGTDDGLAAVRRLAGLPAMTNP